MSDRTTLISFFEKGDFPTEGQFTDLINSVPNFDDDVILFGAQDNLTALAGGGQAGATAITSRLARFTTVASGNDSGILSAAIAGNIIRVANSSGNSLDVFPAVGEEINGLGVNNPQFLFGGTGVTFRSYTTGIWETI